MANIADFAENAGINNRKKGAEMNELLKDIASSARNWEEDRKFENGNYICTCASCGKDFFGHKRRMYCKECATKQDQK